MTQLYDFWTWAAHTSSVVTILAGIVTAVGLVSVWLARARPRLTVTSESGDSAHVDLANVGTSRELRSIWFGFVVRNERGGGEGTGADPWHDPLPIGENRWIELYDPRQVHYGGKEHRHETRLQVPAGYSVWCQFQWQHPLFPWVRVNRVVEWTAADRASDAPPRVLRGTRARTTWKKAMER
jgi:hypothetical protein